MGTWGAIVFVAAFVVYFLVKKNNEGLSKFMLFVAGAGAGLMIGAIWAYILIDNIFG